MTEPRTNVDTERRASNVERHLDERPRLAELMDDLREAIVTAQDQGARPSTVAISPGQFLHLSRAKSRERPPFCVMGMEVDIDVDLAGARFNLR